jgi:hypothetical protein
MDAHNEAIVDMDLYGNPSIRDNIDKAFRDLNPIMSDRFRIHAHKDDVVDHHNYVDDVLLWAVGVIHPGIEEYSAIEDNDSSLSPNVEAHHHSISRIVLQPADLIQRSVVNLDFPEEGGLSVYIFDATENVDPVFLAGVDRMDDASVEYLEELEYSALQESKDSYSFQIARKYQETVLVADRQWTVIVVPTGAAYAPSFDFVVLGAFLLFLATIVVTCLLHRSNARASEMRSLKSQQTREKAKNALMQAQRERHLVRSTERMAREQSTAISAVSKHVRSCF